MHYANRCVQGVEYWSGCPVGNSFDEKAPIDPQFATTFGAAQIHAIFIQNKRTYKIKAKCKNKLIGSNGCVRFVNADGKQGRTWRNADKKNGDKDEVAALRQHSIGHRAIVVITQSADEVETTIDIAKASIPPIAKCQFPSESFKLNA
jgi:hypothetical protein